MKSEAKLVTTQAALDKALADGAVDLIIDLADVDIWRDYTGADRAINPAQDQLILGHVSSGDHPGRLGRDGQIRIGCWSGTVSELRALAASDRWPSGANEGRRDQVRPRLLAFADLCDAQVTAWAQEEAVK